MVKYSRTKYFTNNPFLCTLGQHLSYLQFCDLVHDTQVLNLTSVIISLLKHALPQDTFNIEGISAEVRMIVGFTFCSMLESNQPPLHWVLVEYHCGFIGAAHADLESE
jgi:hypothetical protein